MYKSNPFRIQLQKALEPVKVSLHVPGHKYGQAQRVCGYPPETHLAWDTTEIPGTDNLHEPEGLIREAQARARDFYGSQASFFLVNGTTGGILAMLLTVLEPGDTLLMARDCHQSVYNGAWLAQAQVRWLLPEYESGTLMNLGISKAAVETALKADPAIRAVILTSPTYFGICSDLQGIAEICRSYGVLLLVDEAHGAHFPLSEDLPVSALAAGADLCVQSTHKTLPALTQSSMLHVGSHRVDLDRLRRMLRMVQTSSPSYLLMQSLDQAITLAAEAGPREMARLLDALGALRDRCARLPGLTLPGSELIGRGAVHGVDSTKIIIDPTAWGLSGTALSERLRTEFGIQLELSTPWHALGIATIGNIDEEIRGLGDALEALQPPSGTPRHHFSALQPPGIPPSLLSWRAAERAASTAVPLRDSLGGISGRMVVPYPPGIPVLMPGETITQDIVEYLSACRASGISVLGLQGADNERIQVVNP